MKRKQGRVTETIKRRGVDTIGEEKEILLRGKVCAYLTCRLMGDPRYQIEALESAGVPVSPRMVITAGNLASQLAPLALRPR